LLRIANTSSHSLPLQPVLLQAAAPCSAVVLGHKCYCTGEPVAGVDAVESRAEIVDIGTLLMSADRKNLTAKTACDIVIGIARLKSESKVKESEYLQDERFLKIMKQLESNHTTKVEPLAIISGLKALGVLGINNESFSVKNLENNLTWASRSCPIKDLVMMLSFTMNRRNTENQKLLFNEVCKALERRWVEIKGSSPLIVQAPSDNFWILMNKAHFNDLVQSGKNSPKPLLLRDIKDGSLFVSLLHYIELFSPQFIAKLEDRIADLVEEINPGDLVSILSELGRKKRRNVPLLKSITYYIVKHKNLLDIKQVSDCLFALKQLSYKDRTTLDLLCSQLETLIQDTESPAVLRSVLTSLGQLKYLNTPVLDRIMDWHKDRLEKNIPMSSKDMVTLIMTCATLNYSQNTSFLQQISQNLSQEPGQPDYVWVDTVWSLALLGIATHQHLESVLNHAFYTSLIYNTSNTRTTHAAAPKLLNINAAAQLLYPDYTGPSIKVAEDEFLKDFKISSGLSKVQFSQSVLEAFSTLFPPPRLLRKDVPTMLGCVAEGEFVCDSSARPLPVQELSNNFGTSQPEKTLPEGAHRMVISTASFQDCLIGGEVSGITAFNTRLIEAAGYKVFLVKYTDWDPKSKLLTKAKMLDERLKQVLGVKEDA